MDHVTSHETQTSASEHGAREADLGLHWRERDDTATTAPAAEAAGQDSWAKRAFPNLYEALMRSQAKGEASCLSRAERRAAKRALRRDLRQARKARRKQLAEAKHVEGRERARYRSVTRQLKEAERELCSRTRAQRARRSRAKDVFNAIGFDHMFSSGLCEVEEGLWSETLAFSDISYQSATEEGQRQVINALAELLDYFDAETTLQFTIANLPLTAEELDARTFFDEGAAGPNAPLAAEFNRVLHEKLLEGCSTFRRERYLTYATAAASPVEAARTLARVRSDVRERLGALRSVTHVLTGEERLALISSITRPGRPFAFSYEHDLSFRSPLVAKDFVCPTSLDFSPDGLSALYVSEDTWCQVLVTTPAFAAELTDHAISDLAELPLPIVVTWHLQPIAKARAIEMVRKQAMWIQKEVVDNQKRAVAQGIDYTILPPELQSLRAENERVLADLQSSGQRLFYHTGLVLTWAPTRELLQEQVAHIVRAAHASGIELATLALRQREGLNSVLPLGHNHVDVVRDLTTAEAAILVPFTTQELDMPGGGYYGQNRLSGNLVICNRKRLMSPHGFVCGMSGSGKSFAVKREIANTVLAAPGDEVYVMDVTGEYSYLIERLHGTELTLGPDAKNHLNPLELTCAGGLSPAAALAWKVDAVLAMVAALKAEGGADLTQEERSVLAAALERAYREAEGGLAPVLEDLVFALDECTGEGREVASRLSLVLSRYVEGPLAFLNRDSDVELGASRLVSFNTADVPADMRCLCMLANLETVRQRMLANHERGVATWLYIDEVQSLFAHPAIICYLARLWREGRKFGLVCTGMTQSAAAMGAGGEAATIIDQSGFSLLLRQSDVDRAFWVDARSLSAKEAEAISETCRRGQGLLIADAARVPIGDDFPAHTELYDMFSTSPEDYARLLEQRQAKLAPNEQGKSEPETDEPESATDADSPHARGRRRRRMPERVEDPFCPVPPPRR